MRVSKVPVGVAIALFVASLVAFRPQPSLAADDPFVGTWVLNVAKSKYSPGPPPKEQTVVYEVAGDEVKITAKTVAADGTATAFSYTGKYDGKDYPATGDAAWDTQSLERVGPRTVELTRKKGGKVIQTATNVVSEDGKTRTFTMTGVDASGQKVSSTAVYDKK